MYDLKGIKKNNRNTDESPAPYCLKDLIQNANKMYPHCLQQFFCVKTEIKTN